jgi:hypothetical protein
MRAKRERGPAEPGQVKRLEAAAGRGGHGWPDICFACPRRQTEARRLEPCMSARRRCNHPSSDGCVTRPPHGRKEAGGGGGGGNARRAAPCGNSGSHNRTRSGRDGGVVMSHARKAPLRPAGPVSRPQHSRASNKAGAWWWCVLVCVWGLLSAGTVRVRAPAPPSPRSATDGRVAPG